MVQYVHENKENKNIQPIPTNTI